MAAEPVPPRPTPSSPEFDRRVAEALLGYHQLLPKLREEIDTMSGQILGIHGVIGRLATRVEDIAHSVGADRRTHDSTPPEFEFDVEDTHAGSKYKRVPSETIEKMKTFLAEQQFAANAAKKKREDLELDLKKAKSKRERVLYWLALATAFGGAIVYAIEHLSFR